MRMPILLPLPTSLPDICGSPRYQIVSEENPVVIGEQYDALPTPQHAVVISNDQSVINDAEYDPYITMRFRNYGRQPSRATFSSGRKAISNDRSAMYRTSPNTLRLTGRPTDAAFKENRNEEQHGHSEQEEPATKEYTRGGTSESSREFIPIGKDNEQLLKPSPFSQ
ncbi:hypothetical protein Q1695_011503 [Nippostrongylus brasiliensis]|nr:hypothetical protein Q1695_011503 [Nippostrongylus brasiliensis]